MKNLFYFLSLIFLFSACNQQELTTELPTDGTLSGNWFRMITNRVFIGPGQDPIERGETHFILSFTDDGQFSYKTVTLGLYEGTNPTDTSAWTIDTGTYILNDDEIEISLEDYIWWDSFYEDMTEPETIDIQNSQKYKDVRHTIISNRLKFEYSNLTIEGFEENVEEFERQ